MIKKVKKMLGTTATATVFELAGLSAVCIAGFMIIGWLGFMFVGAALFSIGFNLEREAS
ncbi:MAG: hypothetical protein ABW007_25790 [Chitinophagaceae bacterium]